MAAVLAFLSAAIFALGTVFQQRQAMRESDEGAASAEILFRLARHPVWLAGIAAYALAYGIQAAALGIGQLVVVQPILAPLAQWLVAGLAAGVAVAALLTAGLRRSGAPRAALLGTAAGLLFGFVSGLTKGAVETLTDDGVAALLTSPPPRWSTQPSAWRWA
jgi:hypothetical protein